jgi:hypothetical protein
MSRTPDKSQIGGCSASYVKRIAIFLTMISLVGCKPTWEKTRAPDITGSNALASVLGFVGTNGWESYSKTNTYIFWTKDEPAHYISGLPWKQLNSQCFPALTSGGVLYVLLGDEFHHDYFGVAYNPNTNHFSEWIREFRPIGNHWYVWAQPEFWATATTDGHYE